MSKNKTPILIILILISIIAFVIFAIPNARASENKAMVQMFEPDEAAPLDPMLAMIRPANSLYEGLHNFVFYEYYFYGFPYFASSALSILPLRWLDRLADLSLVMLTLRQVISVLPMLIALLILVYMQDGFKTYRSILLYIFLLSVPAIIQNGFWWHPDGLVLLLSVLVIFFVWRDEQRFGWRFFLTAVLIGILTATKMVGLYFFLMIAIVLVWGLVQKKLTWKKAIGYAIAYIAILAVSYVLANPFLLSKWGRLEFWNIFRLQSDVLSQGYGITYEKGITGAWELMRTYYGEFIFILIAILTPILAIIQKKRTYLNTLLLAWFIPLTVYILFFSHFKYQYWLPVALPLFSSLVLWLSPDWLQIGKKKVGNILRVLILLILLLQCILFVIQDVNTFTQRTNRAEGNEIIQFYDQVTTFLEPVEGLEMKLYYDYRLYVPAAQGWEQVTSYDLLDYGYIQREDFDILLLLRQRILDYLNPEVEGVDPEEFIQNQAFYQDARDGNIENYVLLFEDQVGFIYLHQDVCLEYFPQGSCD